MGNRLSEVALAWTAKDGNSKQALADEMGISKQTLLARLENPDALTLGNAKVIAKLSGYELKELVGR